jgi:hypothetical protein
LPTNIITRRRLGDGVCENDDGESRILIEEPMYGLLVSRWCRSGRSRAWLPGSLCDSDNRESAGRSRTRSTNGQGRTILGVPRISTLDNERKLG